MKRRSARRRKIDRLIGLYGMPSIGFGVFCWVMTTNPHAVVVLSVVLVLSVPLLAIAHQQGVMDGLEWTADLVEREKQP